MSSAPTGVKEAVDPWSLRPVVGKFRIKEGVHSEGAIPGTYRRDPTGAPMFSPRVYVDGDIVASRSDLSKHNPAHGAKKFERVDDSMPDKYDGNAPPVDELEAMTVAQLRELSVAEEIDLGEATKKADIIEWIRMVRQERDQE